MANRAYLYLADRADAWECPEEEYCDSRWAIPLGWFFFYRPGDVRLVDVYHRGGHWQEVRLSAPKPAALARFAARAPLLVAAADGWVGPEALEGFGAAIGGQRGDFLLMNPNEVLCGLSGGDRTHAGRIVEILGLLEDGGFPLDRLREAVRSYAGALDPDSDRCLGQVLGYSYW